LLLNWLDRSARLLFSATTAMVFTFPSAGLHRNDLRCVNVQAKKRCS
jgi:hypothetical protein